MLHNMGTVDRLIRTFLVAPAAIVAAVLVGPASAGGIVLFVVAAVMVGTSAVGFCPLYRLFGISTDSRSIRHA
jgi:hypothetical protein